MKYDAFISYSHTSDGYLAPSIQNELHRIARPILKLRALNVFRDQTNLSVSPDLWNEIEAALMNSRYFILLASEESVKSSWVEKEISTWLSVNSVETILIAVTNGGIEWSDNKNDFDWEKTNCLPKVLEGKFEKEPLFVDFRNFQKSEIITNKNQDFSMKVASLASAIHGKPINDLIGEEVNRRKKVNYMLSGIIMLLFSLSIGLLWYVKESNSNAKKTRKQEKLTNLKNDSLQKQILISDSLTIEAKIERDNAVKATKRANFAKADALNAKEQAQMAQLEAENYAMANSNSLLALQMDKVDPTLALRIAEKNYDLFGGKSAAGVFNTLLENKQVGKYFKEIKQGHTGNITSVATSPNGEHILTGSSDRTAMLWTNDGKQIVTYFGHTGGVTSVTFSPDGKTIATGSTDNTIKIWTISGEEINTITGHQNSILDIAYSPDGKYILTGSSDNSAKLWSLSGEEINSYKSNGSPIHTVDISPNGQFLLTATSDSEGGVKIWEINGKELITINQKENPVESACFSPNGETILVGLMFDSVKIFSFLGEEILSIETIGKMPTSVDFSSSGEYIVIGFEYSGISVFDKNGTGIFSFKDYRSILIARFLPDQNKFIIGTNYCTAEIWDIDGNLVSSFKGFCANVTSTDISPDGKLIAASRSDGKCQLWSIDGELVNSFEAHTGNINSICFSPDGFHLLTSSNDGTAKLWNTNGDEIVCYEGHTKTVRCAEFSDNGKFILTCSNDGTAKLWSIKGSNITTYFGHRNYVNSAALSNDLKYVLTGSGDKSVKLWNINGEEIASIKQEDFVVSVDFSPLSNEFVIGLGNGSIKIYDLSLNLELKFQAHKRWVNSVEFSPNAQSILSSGNSWGEDELFLWSRQAELIQSHVGSRRGFESANISHDGKSIITCGINYSIRLWHINEEQQKQFQINDGFIRSVKISSDGNNILTGDSEGKCILWDNEGIINSIINVQTSVNSVAFSPRGDYILTGSKQRVNLWGLNGKNILELFHGGNVKVVDFAPDGKLFLSGSEDKIVNIWNLKGEKVSVLEGHTGSISSAKFSSDSKYVLTGSGSDYYRGGGDNNTKLWSINGNLITNITGHNGPIFAVDISEDQKYILTGGEDNTIKLWNINGELIKTFTGHTDRVIYSKFIPNNNYFISGSEDGTVRIWSLNGDEIGIVYKDSFGINALDVSSDGKYFLIGTDIKAELILSPWEYLLKSVKSFTLQELRAHKMALNLDSPKK